MMANKIRKLSIIGAGYLGKQIIEKSLLFNYDVNVFDINKEDLEIFTEKMNDKIAKEK
jgi:3-hydroxyacyl-CoA dehydrogenase